MNREAVLFISFGGPEKADDVMPFLEHVTQGRGIPRERLLDVAAHYHHLGGRSPINEITRRQAAALEQELRPLGLNVYVGQRHWHPFLEDTLRRMKADGIERAIGFITAPHRSEPSVERYVRAVEAARHTIGLGAPVIDYVNPWFDHPLFIDAIAEQIRAVASPDFLKEARWVFTAHSIPCALAKTSPYVLDLQRTAELVAARFAQKEWTLAYSSRSGRPQDAWLVPDVSDVLRDEARRGMRTFLFIPIGFVADHVEVLFDLDIEAQATAQEAGVKLVRVATVGEHPAFVRLMAEVVQERRSQHPSSGQSSSQTPLYPACFCFPGTSEPPCQQPAPLRSAAPH